MECCACNFETENVKSYSLNYGTEAMREELFLCDVCVSTRISRTKRYPRQYDNAPLFWTVGHVTNMLLARLDELEAKMDEIEKKIPFPA